MAYAPANSNPAGTQSVAVATATSGGIGEWTANLGGGRFRTTLTLKDVEVATTDAASVGAYGYQKLLDFPKGWIRINSTYANLDIESTGSSVGIVPTATYDVGIGTAPNNAANAADDLVTTEIDLLGKQEGNLSAGSADIEDADVIDAIFDGSSTAKDAYLNVMIEQDDHGATAGEVTFNGTIVIDWQWLGIGE